MKRYFHPQHGYHVANSSEEEALLKNGWKECGWEVKKPAEKRETIKLKKEQ